MSDSSGSGYDDVYDGMWTRLPVVSRSRWMERTRAAMRNARRRQAVTQNSFVHRFRAELESDEFQHHVRMASIRNEVKEYFSNKHNFKYLKTMRSTSTDGGGANLFADMDRLTGMEIRRLIVKYSDDTDTGDNEIKWMNLLGGLEHVVNVIYMDDDALRRSRGAAGGAHTQGEDVDMHNADNMTSTRGLMGSLVNSLSQLVIRPPRTPSRPTIVLEYLESSDLHALRQRFKEAGAQPPVGFLWRVLLCLLRACLGMACYPYIPAGERETIQEGMTPMQLIHGKLDCSHVLIGPLTPDDDEHGFFPRLKLSGFGHAELKDVPPGDHVDDGEGVRENLQAIGRVIETLACPHSDDIDEGDGLLALQNWEYEDDKWGTVVTKAHEDFIDNLSIPSHFSYQVCSLMARDPTDMPTLEDLLRRCERAVRMTPEKLFPTGVPDIETDAAMQRMVQDIVLNIPAVAPPEDNTAQVDDTAPGRLAGVVARLPEVIDATLITLAGGQHEPNGSQGPENIPMWPV
ncbi:hypothetical protein BJ170DRAFT_713415 [Xylariales sp. AK1849]|nr:hypothetical protein BJ170DRAFT_713415 [Xylariales sp. AK1849]